MVSYTIFSISALAYLVSMMLPSFFPWMKEGMGIGLLVLVLVGPPLLFSATANVIIFIRKFNKKLFNYVDIFYLIMSLIVIFFALTLVGEM